MRENWATIPAHSLPMLSAPGGKLACKPFTTPAFAQALLPHPRCTLCLYHLPLQVHTGLLHTGRTARPHVPPLPARPQATLLRVILLRDWDEESPGHWWTDTISSPVCPYSPVLPSPVGI